MPRAIASFVDNVARQAVGKDWAIYAALLEHWQEIVGTEYARLTTPVKITFPHQPTEPRRRNGTLTVKLPKGLAMEFSFKTGQIKQRVNNYFGYDAIGKIIFDPVYNVAVAPAPVKQASAESMDAIRETAKTIDNNELREVLQSLGEAIAQNDKLR